MQQRQVAYVLHSRPYKETSALVTFFAQEQGKFNAIVRGVRGQKAAKKSSLIQPLQKLELAWKSTGRSDLVTLQEIEFAGLSFPLTGSANICGLYANEILYRLLFPQMENGSLFAAYEQLLYELTKTTGFIELEKKRALEMALRQFEYLLLVELLEGFSLDLLDDLQPESNYQFIAEQGWQLYASGISGKALLGLRDGRMDAESLPSLKQLMRYHLAQLLGNKPLNTRKLFQ